MNTIATDMSNVSGDTWCVVKIWRRWVQSLIDDLTLITQDVH